MKKPQVVGRFQRITQERSIKKFPDTGNFQQFLNLFKEVYELGCVLPTRPQSVGAEHIGTPTYREFSRGINLSKMFFKNQFLKITNLNKCESLTIAYACRLVFIQTVC